MCTFASFPLLPLLFWILWIWDVKALLCCWWKHCFQYNWICRNLLRKWTFLYAHKCARVRTCVCAYVGVNKNSSNIFAHINLKLKKKFYMKHLYMWHSKAENTVTRGTAVMIDEYRNDVFCVCKYFIKLHWAHLVFRSLFHWFYSWIAVL